MRLEVSLHFTNFVFTTHNWINDMLLCCMALCDEPVTKAMMCSCILAQMVKWLKAWGSALHVFNLTLFDWMWLCKLDWVPKGCCLIFSSQSVQMWSESQTKTFSISGQQTAQRLGRLFVIRYIYVSSDRGSVSHSDMDKT